MKFRSLSAALGWYAARRRGPEMRSGALRERVQSAYEDDDATHMAIAAALSGLPEHARERLLEWATDRESDLDASGSRSVRWAWQELTRIGIVEKPQRLPETERDGFVDLETGEFVWTRRIKG